MKNKQEKSKKLIVSIMFFAIVAFGVSSCSKTSDPISGENNQTASNEYSQESSTDELDDMANVALNANTAAGNRIETITDDRLICDGTTVLPGSSNTADAGTVTITFGTNGCKDKKGNVRKGKITIEWHGGKWYTAGSYHTITLTDYSINGVKISGTRTVSTTSFTPTPSLPSFTLVSSVTANHTITWSDNTSATRTVSKNRTWIHTSTEDTISETNGSGADFTASGTNRRAVAYTMIITKPLIYLGSCIKSNHVFVPVSGTKVVTNVAKPNLPLTIDFGASTCDNTFTLTVDGHTKTIGASIEQ